MTKPSQRLLSHYESALEHDLLSQGLTWYQEAHKFAQGLADASGLPLDTIAQVIAILSPAVSWQVNKRDALSLLHHGEEASVSTYGRNKAKALAVLQGLDAINPKALKTFNFYQNILNPAASDAVTIDRHAWKAYTGKARGGTVRLNVERYKRAAACYRVTAKHLGLLPCDLQAIVWLDYRANTLGLINH